MVDFIVKEGLRTLHVDSGTFQLPHSSPTLKQQHLVLLNKKCHKPYILSEIVEKIGI